MATTQMKYPQVIGAVLAGGRSLRMGRPKADILLGDGRSMIAHVIAQMKKVCPEVVIVGGAPASMAGVSPLPDTTSGLGPLGGLNTLLSSGRASAYLIVACDQPLLTPEILHLLLAGDPAVAHLFQPIQNQPVDPFPGYYPATLLPRDVSATEKRSMQHFIQTIPVTFIPLPASLRPCIKSLNTPEDLANLVPPVCPA